MTQKEPDLLTDKLVLFVDHVGKAVSSKGIQEEDIIAMDETVIGFDIVYSNRGDPPHERCEALKTRNHKESHLTVVLAAKADGTKLRPYIIFRGAVDEVRTMQQQITSAVITTSANGLMTDALTADWLQSVVGKFNPTPRLLVWDAYHCHTGDAFKN